MGWADTYRTLGAKGFASYAFTRAIAPVPGLVYRRYHIIALPRVALPSMPRGHCVRALSREEVACVADDLELSTGTIDFRTGQGMTCLGAFRGERLLGVNWVTNGPFDEDEVAVRFVPPPGAAWDTGLYIRPEDRGSRAFAALWAGTGDWLAQHGLDWSMSRITDYNEVSRRAHARMGAIAVYTPTPVRIGGRKLIFGARPSHPRLGPDTVPPVLLLPMPGSVG